MAFDRNTTASNKPFLPRLASTKSPITPRLAAQHLRASPSTSVVSQSSNRGAGGFKGQIHAKDDTITPIKSLLNSNITPRSSHRKSRIETGSNISTPSGTPIHSPLPDASAHAKGVGRGSSNGTINGQRRPKSVLLDGTSLDALSPTFQDPGVVHEKPALKSSNFFHANEVVSTDKPNRPQPKKTNSFFYANGMQDQPSGNSIQRSPSPTASALSVKTNRSQFHYADGTAEDDDIALLPESIGYDPRPQLSRHQSNSSSTQHFAIRPASPQKSSFHLTFRKGASQVLPTRSPIVSPPPNTQALTSPKNKRRSIVESQSNETPQPHARNVSVSSIDTTPSTRRTSPSTADLPLRQIVQARGSPTVTSNPFTPLDKTFGAIDGLHDSVPSPRLSQPAAVTPTSPKHNVPQVPPNFAEAAANARRERKVLDLEISNSSLLAINRQLEREVRRQKMELRRFRRLSRAGRLSSLGSMLPFADKEDGDRSENDDILEDSEAEQSSDKDEDDSHDLSPMSEGSLASDAMSHGGYARLEKDEKRLKLDLDRHRQLLVDSQKMNQSLKRCMAWTEEMIAEGRKALAYKVNVSDIRLGGRVLQEDDISTSAIIQDRADEHDTLEGDSMEPRQGLLGSWSPPSSTTPLTSLANAADELFGFALNLPDATTEKQRSDIGPPTARDSGVDVNHISHELLEPV